MAKYKFIRNYSSTGKSVDLVNAGKAIDVNKDFKTGEIYDGVVSGNNINITATGGRKSMGGGTYSGSVVYPIPTGGGILVLESGTPVVDSGTPSTTTNLIKETSIFTATNVLIVGGVLVAAYLVWTYFNNKINK
jgi:hypothetical protein